MTPTRNGRMPEAEDIPKGCRVFRVVGPMICDNTNTYCDTDDWAVLDKKTAQHYLDLGLIRVELPEDFDNGDDPSKTALAAISNKSEAKP